MLRTWPLIVAAFVPVLPVALPAQATETAPSPVVWEAVRVAPNASHVAVHAKYRFEHFDGMVAYISLADTRRGVLPTEGLALDSPSAHVPYGYTGSVEEGCEPDGPCDVLTGPGAADFRFEEPVGSPQPAKIYLVILGEQQQVELVESPGWRLTRTRLRATIVRANSATGVVVADERAEHFAEASGTGGAHGSLAVGTPPCRLAHRTGYVREGYGSATLTGGQRPASFSCGGVPAAFDPVAYAQTRTRWRLAGSVTGDAMGPTRLTIINL